MALDQGHSPETTWQRYFTKLTPYAIMEETRAGRNRVMLPE